MRLSFEIAKRYLFGKKSTNAINLITGISIFGITIGTAALILILSVFNGFEGLLGNIFNAFNPDLLIKPIEGKTVPIDDKWLAELRSSDFVDHVSVTIEEVALFEYNDVQEFGILKGVDSYYPSVTGIDTLLVSGSFQLRGGEINYGLIAADLRNKLGVSIHNSLSPITVYSPTRKKSFGNNADFTFKDIHPRGVFAIQSDNDYQYILTNIKAASELFQKEGQISAYEVKLKPTTDVETFKDLVATTLPKNLSIKTRYEQDAAFLNIMRIEKWVSYLIVSLTMLLIAFNLIGCLWMIVLEKKGDIATLKAMGYTKRNIFFVFLNVGLLICIVGMFIGIALALSLYFLQTYFGLISVPEGFLIDAYPIELKLFDIIVVITTVLGIGLLASFLPAQRSSKIAKNVVMDL